ncbi:MAG: alpha/beta hydrolase [Armatimonadota bacterium]|nr:alpha/beta hydrolase [bacterium]
MPIEPTSDSIYLWKDGEYNVDSDGSFKPWLDTFLIDADTPKPAILICPGGGYAFRSAREANPVARRFNELGFHAFVVHYSIAKHPQPVMDMSRAVRIVRSRAGEWMVDPSKIAVCGFSAGGHLAASIGVHYGKNYLRETGEFANFSNRPDAMILSYPVITSGEYAHRPSFDYLLGENASDAALREMSLELHVDSSTPPAFLWHTADDPAVPVENSLMFASALRRHSVAFEMHIFGTGPHGFSLATEETRDHGMPNDPHVATWIELCAEWVRK